MPTIYEPRSLWSESTLTLTRAVTVPAGRFDRATSVRLNRDHFRNTERVPLILQRLAVAMTRQGVNRLVAAPGAQGNQLATAGASALRRLRVHVYARGRSHLSVDPMHLGGLAPRPTHEPVARDGWHPGLMQSVRLKLDPPLQLGVQGAIELNLSRPPVIADVPGSDTDIRLQVAVTQRLPQAQGYRWGGAARVFDPVTINHNTIALEDEQLRDFPTQLRFGAEDFRTRELARTEAEVELHGIHVAIDQLALDQAIRTATPGAQPASQALSIGTRVRSAVGGSGSDWWRAGAPLALVFDAQTPALVYEFAEPLIVEPDTSLDVEVEVPLPADPTTALPLPAGMELCRFGLALNGHAVLKVNA